MTHDAFVTQRASAAPVASRMAVIVETDDAGAQDVERFQKE